MKRVSCFAICVFLSFLWGSTAGAGENKSPAPQTPPAATQGDQIIKPKEGISWKEKVMMQREIQKKAAARRNILMNQAESAKQKGAKEAPPQSQTNP